MRRLGVLLTAAALTAACNSGEPLPPDSIRLLAHDSFAEGVSDETFARFTADTGIAVEVIAGGDTGSMVNQAVLSADNPIADVIFGIDDTFLSRALENDILRPFESELLNQVPAELRLDESGRATPIDFGDVCINFQKEWFAETQLDLPEDLDDLRSELYASFLTVEHPATSSPGLAFMLATIDVLGEDRWLDFWADLKAAGVRVAPDWDSAYYGDFRQYGGPSSMVVSYASSPAAEVIFAEEPISQAPTGSIDAGCYRQVEFAGVLDGTEHPDEAGQLIDFMLSVEFQEEIPLTWFVFPANESARLPDEFVAYTTLPANPVQMDPGLIADNRDRWISEWVAVMEG